MFNGLISVKETLFCMTFEVRWPTGQLVCVAYKFNLTVGLTLCLDLFCLLLLLLYCLRPDLNDHVFQLFTLSSLCCHWYGFKCFCGFLYMIPSSVLIL